MSYSLSAFLIEPLAFKSEPGYNSVEVKNFKLFAFSFLLSSFFFYLCSPFGLRVSGAVQKDWVIAQKTLKQTGVAQLVE